MDRDKKFYEDEVFKNMQMISDNVTSSCIKPYPESAHKVTDYSLEIKDLPELGTGIISTSYIIKTGLISILGQWFVDDVKRKLLDLLSLDRNYTVKLYRHVDNYIIYEGDMKIVKIEFSLDAYKAEGYATMFLVFEGV